MTQPGYKRLVTEAQLDQKLSSISTNGVVGPKGDTGETGPANTLTIGTVTKIAPGGTPTATITGTAPSQILNLGLVTGDTGAAGTGGGTVSGVSTVNTRSGDVTLTKSDVGLANVDNTADTAKPVSTAQQSALNLKVDATAASTGQLYYNNGGTPAGVAFTTAGTISTIAQRDANGQLTVAATPTATTHAASKTYVDTNVSTRVGNASAANSQVYAKDSTGTNIGLGYAQAATASALVQRNSDGTAIAADPTASTHLATKNYADTALALKAPLASPTFTGTPAAPTATAGTNTTQVATTAFVTGALSAFAPSASPTFTGTPSAPTAVSGTNTTQIATTAFVVAGFAPTSRTLTAGTGLQGGGNLSADRSFALSTAAQASLAKADAAVASDGNILRVLKITSAAYAALASKDANTLYVVVG